MKGVYNDINSSHYLLNAYCMLGTILSTLPISISALIHRRIYHLHLSVGKIEAQSSPE